jgi:transcriptional regulator with XRE-family HTH domain
MPTTHLPTRIRLARRHARLTQARLAEQLAVRPSAVAQWENPVGTLPTGKHMAEIAVATGVCFEWLATGRGAMTIEPAEAPAISADAIAMDETEEKVLRLLRNVAPSARQVVVQMLEGLTRR